MIQKVNFNMFCDAFLIRKNNFSSEGLIALFDYLEFYEEDTGQEIKLDVIALCCDYTEYKNLDSYLNDFYTTDEINQLIEDFKEENPCLLEEEPCDIRNLKEFNDYIEDKIRDKTTLIKFADNLNKGFIIQNY